MKKSVLAISALMLPATVAIAAPSESATNGPGSNTGSAPVSAPALRTGSFESDTASRGSQFKRNMARVVMPADKTDGPGYTYAQGAYIPEGHLSGTGNDFDGYGGDISLAFPTGSQAPVHPILQGGWHRLNVHNGPLEINQSYVGLGGETFYDYGGAKGTGIGAYGTVNYERLQFRHLANNAGPTADGWSITGGLRWMAMPQLELNPHATYYDYGKISGNGVDWGSPDGFGYGLRLIGYLDQAQHYALTVGYDRTDFDIGPSNLQFHDVVNVGARFTF